MQFRKLGQTDIDVSLICLGTMTWCSQNSEAEAHAQIDYALNQGVNFIDTAEGYPVTPVSAESTGRTEEYIGSWIAQSGKRDQIVLATKVAGPGRPNDVRQFRGATTASTAEILNWRSTTVYAACAPILSTSISCTGRTVRLPRSADAVSPGSTIRPRPSRSRRRCRRWAI